MKNASIIALSIVLLAIGGCANYYGKGKAPPPAAAPIVTKG